MRVYYDIVVPLFDRQQSIARNREAFLALIKGLSQRFAYRLFVSRILLGEVLADLLETLPVTIFLFCDSPHLADLRRYLKRDWNLFADPAGNRACRIRYSANEDLVAADTLHHPRGPTDDELSPGLSILSDKRLVQDPDSRVSLLLNHQVLFLIRDH